MSSKLITRQNWLFQRMIPASQYFHFGIKLLHPRGCHSSAIDQETEIKTKSEKQNLTEKLYQKYGYLFNVSASDDSEVIYRTSFGHVRLDSDNEKRKIYRKNYPIQPSLNEMVDMNTGEFNNTLTVHDECNKSNYAHKSSFNTPNTGSENYIEDQFFYSLQEQASLPDNPAYPIDNKCERGVVGKSRSLTSTSSFENIAGLNSKISPLDLNEERNYFEEQYFDSVIESAVEGESKHIRKSSNIGSSSFKQKNRNTALETSDMNFFDEIYIKNESTSQCTVSGVNPGLLPDSLGSEAVPNEICQTHDTTTTTEFYNVNKLQTENNSNYADSNEIDSIEEILSDSPTQLNKFLKPEVEDIFHETMKKSKNPLPYSNSSTLHTIHDLEAKTRTEIFSLLKRCIIYNKNDIVAIDKPYGLKCQPDGILSDKLDLKSHLPKLAEYLKVPNLNIIHRLDKVTSGVLLLGTNDTITRSLKQAFKEQKVIKLYWSLVVGNLYSESGLINIPIAEGKIGGKYRMVLHPIGDSRFRNKKSKAASTEYKVLSRVGKMSLVEVRPITGVKHQVRVHFGFGLGCPILGDHKYSHLTKLAPQRLPDKVLKNLSLPQSKVRTLPLYLHAKQIIIPNFLEGRDFHAYSYLPKYFYKMAKKLGFDLKSIKASDHMDLESIDKEYFK